MNEQREGRERKRLLCCDALRGVAILLVLVTHTWTYAGAPAYAVRIGTQNLLLASLPAVGYVGVNLFLVLSGFCLALPFAQDPRRFERTTLWQFMRRRLLRILPAYYGSMAAVLLLYAAFAHFAPHLPAPSPAAVPAGSSLLRELIPHLFLLHNLSLGHAQTLNGSYWSLALESQLYLLFPLLLLAVRRWGVGRMLLVVLGAQLVYRGALTHALDTATIEQYQFVLPKALFGRMFDFAMGIGVASLVSAPRRVMENRLRTGIVAPALLTAAFTLTWTLGSEHPLVDIVWAAGFGTLLYNAVLRERANTKAASRFQPLVSLGLISYSVYLLHQPIIACLGSVLLSAFRPGLAFFVGLVCLPGVIAVAAAYYAGVEAPFLRRMSGRRPALPRPNLEPKIEPNTERLLLDVPAIAGGKTA